ncbi:conserved hypothetical protein [Rippkaea orientalis PCC 8801]|uniref:Uncharacterized protein n=1 Tax=Rippkaea orientalis (strain PCC 8801 / RF-1) TaxID=41431 RepID=B7JUF9_RIPO1|nr:hypothetical protein [Rippkaea orientalis]ACK64539.1 conserved hypothetical protein [Rippkaea orientalis PCC 8801]
MTWKVKLWKFKQIWGAVWEYLNQPLFAPNKPMIWKLSHFWYSYKIQLLEKCLNKDKPSESHYTQ